MSQTITRAIAIAQDPCSILGGDFGSKRYLEIFVEKFLAGPEFNLRS